MELKTSSMYFEARKIIRYTILQIQILIRLGTQTVEIEKNIELCFGKYQRFLRADEKLELLFLVIAMYFNHRSMKVVKRWLREYYLLPKSKTRIDLQLYIMIINIYMNYFSRDYDHMNYLIRNTERFERNEGILDQYELRLLELLKNEVNRSRALESDQTSLEELKRSLAVLPSERNEMSMAKYIDF